MLLFGVCAQQHDTNSTIATQLMTCRSDNNDDDETDSMRVCSCFGSMAANAEAPELLGPVTVRDVLAWPRLALDTLQAADEQGVLPGAVAVSATVAVTIRGSSFHN